MTYTTDPTGLMFIGILIGFIITALFVLAFAKNKSKNYRKYLTNMYVSGRIKQLSERDKINLNEIEKEYLKWLKFSVKDRIFDLDDSIERELIMNIDEEIKKN